MKVVIVDYGMGNIKSIFSALKFLDVERIVVSNKRAEILLADRLILPGVGSFSKAMRTIKDLNIDKYLEEAVLFEEKPILGICLGMQLMCMSSEEDGCSKGLGFVGGVVEKIGTQNFKVPHVGFNQVCFSEGARLYNDMENKSDFYFTHSFKVQGDVQGDLGYCDYGSDFIASYEVKNIAGVQFHPELSQRNGLKLMSNFLKSF